MTTKTTGAEWKRFYSDKEFWPDEWWHDDEVITVNGKNAHDFDIELTEVLDSDVMTVSAGVVYDAMSNEGPSLEGHFKSWRKKQTTVFFTVEAPKEKADAVKSAITSSGGKVIA